MTTSVRIGLLAVAVLTGPALASAQIPQALIDHRPSIAVTKQTGTFGGQTVPYVATVEEHILKGRDSVPNAFLVTIAYVRDDVPDKSKRPVAFVFNGGPGASSSPLHFSGIGPRVGVSGGVANNPNSILDASDLVFIDPVGTGFSRPYTTEIGKEYYWYDAGDAASVKEVIDRWLAKNGREQSPRYLIGESYGTVRIGRILQLPNARFDGVVLVSAIAEPPRPAFLAYVRAIPSMAVAAWHHERVPRNGRSADQVWSQALTFVRTELAPALAKNSVLPAGERRRIAERMSALIGLPTMFIEQKNLRLTAEDWLLNVLRDKSLRVSNQDTRVTGPLVLTAAQAAAASPVDGLGGTRPIGTAMYAPALVAGTPEADSVASPRRARSALETYLRNDLQFQTIEDYRSVNLDINPLWYSNGRTIHLDVATPVAAGMRANPKMRMFWIQGYYDLNTPAYAALLSYQNAGLTGSRVSGMMAPGPHTAFATDESKQVLSAALRKWIR